MAAPVGLWIVVAALVMRIDTDESSTHVCRQLLGHQFALGLGERLRTNRPHAKMKSKRQRERRGSESHGTHVNVMM
jgi:hypothetical protein